MEKKLKDYMQPKKVIILLYFDKSSLLNYSSEIIFFFGGGYSISRLTKPPLSPSLCAYTAKYKYLVFRGPMVFNSDLAQVIHV